jgi:C-terminal processing protease CtpA/Prc
LVIGETSFGKGTVQNMSTWTAWPTSETERFGQVKLTIAQFFRISGGSTQHKGVVPDMAFPASVDATEFGESTYDNALPWTRIAAVPHTQYGNFAPLLPRWTACMRRGGQGPRVPVVEEDVSSSAPRRRRSTSRSTRPTAVPSATSRMPSARSARPCARNWAWPWTRWPTTVPTTA